MILALAGPVVGFAGTLADSPLSLRGAVPPNVMFALSVEFPTAVIAAYPVASGYAAGNEYKGYFASDKCYKYNSSDVSASNTGYFIPVRAHRDSRVCNGIGEWSGNFLNWATMTGLDEFRYAMTGGNRYLDTATETVLERAYQNTQGWLSLFPDKTIADFSATGSAGSLSISNYGKGVQMQVTQSGSDTATCTNPQLAGAFSCALALQTSGSTGSCTTWTGDGSVSTPYRCTSFGPWSGGETFASSTPVNVSAVADSSTTSVSCTNPTFDSNHFDCTLTRADGTTGSCSGGWTGNGSAATPYQCATFGLFGTDHFNPSSQDAAANFSPTVTVATPRTDTINTANCTGGGAVNTNMTCPLGIAGKTASCKIVGGSGSSGSPFVCDGTASNWSFNDPAYSWTDWTQGSRKSWNGKYYRFPATVSYSYSTTTTPTLYYIPRYSGGIGDGYSYYSTYTMSLTGTANYNVRVRVCDTSIGVEDNCKQYGSSWKPTGVVQDYGDRMRFGVMSYFMRDDFDNAVMRSKLKYVAPQKYASSGGTAANSSKEWSETDGTLVTDPDSADAATHNSYVGIMPRSGVINYINQFGSYPAAATPAYRYKGQDDVGKLYYETLRYLRGLSPTPDFYQGAQAGNADGFPIITTWDDPILYSCQKNYIITLGDHSTWCDRRLPGSTLVNSSGECTAYTDAKGNAHVADGAASAGATVSLNGDTVNVKTETDWVGTQEGMTNLGSTKTGYASKGSYFMAGLAAWAARNDIRANVEGKQTVKTFVINVEQDKDCGYRTQFWLAAKYGDPANYDSSGNWMTVGNPWSTEMILAANECSSTDKPAKTTSGADFSVATGGTVDWPKGLLRASNPQRMIDSVRNALASIGGEIGDESALAQSSGSLDTGTGAYVYRATYNSSGWTGNVEALTIDTSGTIASTPAWSAEAKLPAPASRNIFTFNDGRQADGTSESTDYSRKGVAFDPANFSTYLSSGQVAALNRSELGASDALGADRMNFMRGDHSQERNASGTNGKHWRYRGSHVLGDFINSNPLYVAGPSADVPGQNSRSFAVNNRNRKPMVYVGGNDGMLHAFDASFTVDSTSHLPVVTSTSGTELFAYVPSAVYSNLSQLMSSNYSHKFFVDGSPVAGDVCLGSNCATNADVTADWKTILVGGLNAGGQGIYALDITDPTSFTASNVLWEFTEQDDSDLGYTFGKPLIRRMNNNRWAVIFGNGFNNSKADNHSSATGRAYLYIVYVDGPTGTDKTWTLNTDYYKIELKSPSEPATPTLPLSPPNGLAAVSGVDADQNGTVDRLYVGDRNGNIWAIDVSSSAPADWKSAFNDVSHNPQPLFTAVDSSNNAQQITTSLTVARHPQGGYMVLFGTGSWVDVADPLSPFITDSVYGIWDKNDGSTRVSGRSELQRQKVLLYVDDSGNTCTPATATGNCWGITSKCVPNYSTTAATQSNVSTLCTSDIAYAVGKGQQHGWYFDFPGNGERIFSDRPKIDGSVATFTSVQPATNPCTGNTTGMEYNFAWLTGGQPSSPVYALSNSTGTITVTIGTQTVAVIPSSTRISGGAADIGVEFKGTPPPGANSCAPPAGTPSPPTSACVGTACNSEDEIKFVPGWGFVWNLLGPTAGGSKGAKLNCKPPEFGGGLPTCTWLCRQGQSGRISWRQIIR
jgi:type IV pilus assembly protein PilY1